MPIVIPWYVAVRSIGYGASTDGAPMQCITAIPTCNVTHNAILSFYHAAALAPDITEAHELLAHTLRDMGSVDEAIQRYQVITAQRST